MHRREEFRSGINVKMKAQEPSGILGQTFKKTFRKKIFLTSDLAPSDMRCFATFGRTGGCDPLGVSKRSVVELSGKDQQIALAVYS